VILISGPTSLKPPAAAEVTWVESAAQMREAALRLLPESSIVIKTAAVADYTVKDPAEEKIKRSGRTNLELEPTTDILAEISRSKSSQIVVGFAAETHFVIENARKKLASKSLDAIVVNDVSRDGIGFDSDRNAVTILTAAETIEVFETSKWDVAQRVLDCVVELMEKKKRQTVGS
jgi:phosphopantothenoylcysteine decarboxylase/phosphopantothenate--cysteine ligase